MPYNNVMQMMQGNPMNPQGDMFEQVMRRARQGGSGMQPPNMMKSAGVGPMDPLAMGGGANNYGGGPAPGISPNMASGAGMLPQGGGMDPRMTMMMAMMGNQFMNQAQPQGGGQPAGALLRKYGLM